MRKALILAGGKGARVKKFTDRIKPLVIIAGQPMLSILSEQLKNYETYINCNREHEKILKSYGNLIVEEKRLGNATPIRLFAEQCKESFLVMHCDVFSNIDFNRLIEQHKKSDCLMTMAVKNISKRKSFGLTIFDRDKVAIAFSRDRYVNMGIYICKPEIKDFILNNTYQDLDRDLITRLIEKKKLNVYIHQGMWYDVGSNDYQKRHMKSKDKEMQLASTLKKEKK